MTDEHEDSPNIRAGLLVALGLGIGALLGLALARRAARQSHVEVVQSVEELKERTQRLLNDLSENVAGLLDQTRSTRVETSPDTIAGGAEGS
ncbi:MAG: hypothetical protein JO250_06960 [Armatimonadetes bacterium]|nr:hypothetical protein [Armatimonadota bacterium]